MFSKTTNNHHLIGMATDVLRSDLLSCERYASPNDEAWLPPLVAPFLHFLESVQFDHLPGALPVLKDRVACSHSFTFGNPPRRPTLFSKSQLCQHYRTICFNNGMASHNEQILMFQFISRHRKRKINITITKQCMPGSGLFQLLTSVKRLLQHLRCQAILNIKCYTLFYIMIRIFKWKTKRVGKKYNFQPIISLFSLLLKLIHFNSCSIGVIFNDSSMPL